MSHILNHLQPLLEKTFVRSYGKFLQINILPCWAFDYSMCSDCADEIFNGVKSLLCNVMAFFFQIMHCLPDILEDGMWCFCARWNGVK
mmetsp:Transcript_14676/g.25083  ORF Transcript_14676/g.25083 Transcript_14676/m.25083 type:complete len:88 (+) Transcript_14676:1060-1323(+)